MLIALLVLNLLVSLASAAWAVVALGKPGTMSGSTQIEDGERFYARMYAVRSVPLEVAAGILPFWVGGPAVAWLLFLAATIQLADVAIAAAKRDRGMTAGAALGALIHAACGVAIL